MSLRHFFILLLCYLEISLAVAAYDSRTVFEENFKISDGADSSNTTPLSSKYENNGLWEWPASLSIKEHRDDLLFPSNPEDLHSDIISMNDLFLIEEGDEVGKIQFSRSGSLEYYYLDHIAKNASENDDLLRGRSSATKTYSPELQYIYKNDKAQQWLLDYSSSLGRSPDDKIDYMDSEAVSVSADLINEIATPSEEEDRGVFRSSDSYSFHEASQESITQLIATFTEAPRAVGASAIVEDEQTSSLFSSSLNSYLKEDNLGSIYAVEDIPSSKSKKYKNYAIVVGIDEYKDRMSLNTCANDARSIADLMTELGYDVLLLSDETEDKPTKSNILQKAFEEIKREKNIGNVIFYFSGHGTKGEDDTFYLIPQDANGDVSSYISEDEIKQQIKDFKNLAIIIDACNSEGLSPAVGDGQLIMASSQSNQTSNGEWTGSMSVFTSNLIKAIEEERTSSRRVLIQRCFQRASLDTIRWSRNHLINQTPFILDFTGGIYFIN